MKTLLIVILSFTILTPLALAKTSERPKLDTKFGTDLPLLADAMIEVTAYDEATDTYEINAVNFPGEGPTFVTPEGLAKGVRTIDLKRIKRSPTSIVGQQFKTDHKVPGLRDEERELRKKTR